MPEHQPTPPEHRPTPPEHQPTPPEHQPTPPEPQPTPPEPQLLAQPPPAEAPPPPPRTPVLRRPWLPLTLCLLLAVLATALTAKAIVDRDEASRAIDTAEQQTNQVEEDIADEEASLEEANETGRKLQGVSSDCRRASKLVIAWMERIDALVEEAQTGSLQSFLAAGTRTVAARKNMDSQLRNCERQATKVT